MWTTQRAGLGAVASPFLTNSLAIRSEKDPVPFCLATAKVGTFQVCHPGKLA